VGGPHGYRCDESGSSRRVLVDQPEQGGDPQRPSHVQLRLARSNRALAPRLQLIIVKPVSAKRLDGLVTVTRNRGDHGACRNGYPWVARLASTPLRNRGAGRFEKANRQKNL
jgi:hypothetical protein